LSTNLNKKELESVKQTLFVIYSFFSRQTPAKRRFVSCIRKWAQQLEVSNAELEQNSDKPFKKIKDSSDIYAIDSLYDLIYLIHMDDVLEDVEIELAMVYAENLGFESHAVGDFVRSIVRAPHYDVQQLQVKEDLKEILNIHFST
jgi:hypothetical protein